MTATATRITAKDIHLARVMPGFYSYNAPKAAASYTILKQAPGVWTIKTRITRTRVEDTWIVDSVKAARAFIASHMVDHNLI